MKFALDYQITVGERRLDSATLLKEFDSIRGELADVGSIEGMLVVTIDGHKQPLEYSEPLIRHINQWVYKLPWIISGDTETVALRNSEQCFGFIPAGDSVELSFFNGTEAEVEDYLIEPIHIRLDLFVPQVLSLGERIAKLIQTLDPGLVDRDDDCRALSINLPEAQRAWRERQRQRR